MLMRRRLMMEITVGVEKHLSLLGLELKVDM